MPTVARASSLFQDILPWAITLLALVVVGAVVIAITRRRIRGTDDVAHGFTLHDLRQLHAAGKLSDDEFESAKATLIGRVTAPRGDADGGAGDAPDEPDRPPDPDAR